MPKPGDAITEAELIEFYVADGQGATMDVYNNAYQPLTGFPLNQFDTGARGVALHDRPDARQRKPL